MKRLCTICARGGSKGVKDKNIRPLLGKSLLAHSIEQARRTDLFECLAVSSDSPAILDAASAAGADYLIERPLELASDSSAKLPAIQHCARETEARTGVAYDTFVDLDATAPLRTSGDIAGAVALCEKGACDNVITGCRAHRSPYFNLVEEQKGGFVAVAKRPGTPILRRQDVPNCFDCNASIYVWPRAIFMTAEDVLLPRTALYEMPPERSHDVDSELDFEIVEFLMRRLMANNAERATG
jgi:N-acylneuraminate cytidylyltransferase/CMP-N,N'-diacetyllegionaminic acid synthase